MDPIENNHKQRRWLIAALVVVAAVLAGGFFLRRDKKDGGDLYRTEAVDRGGVTMTVSATGTVSAVTTVQVGSQVSGIIAKLYTDFNGAVKKGQLLAELDPTPFEQTVEQRRADVVKSQVSLTNALITFNRQKKMAEAGLVALADLDTAKSTYDGAKAQLDQSQAALRQSQTNLAYTKIYSPIDGVVVARNFDIGQTVAASFQAPTLFTIAKDLTKMQVQADVDQSDIGQISVGEVSRFTVDAYPETEFRGQIAQVRLNATVNQNVITYPVIIEVANPDGKLRPSMTANVTIEVQTVANVLRVPNAALRFKPTDQEGAKGGRAGGRQAGGGGGAGAGRAGGAGAERPSFERGAAERNPGGLAGLSRALPGEEGRSAKPEQAVYILREADDKGGRGGKGGLRRIVVRTGITDGHYTQIVSGDLKPGDKVVTAMATAKVQTTGTLPGQGGGGRPPGMGGRF
jgi:HlyD family secretion protein